MAAEEWRQVDAWPYQVSDLGNVRRSTTGRILRPVLQRNGYLFVDLSGGSRTVRHRVTVHSIIAAAFIGPRPAGKVINHIDHNKRNNAWPNLEYVTQRENLEKAAELGRKCVGISHGMAKLTPALVRAIRQLHADRASRNGRGAGAIAKELGLRKGTVGDVLMQKTWRGVV